MTTRKRKLVPHPVVRTFSARDKARALRALDPLPWNWRPQPATIAEQAFNAFELATRLIAALRHEHQPTGLERSAVTRTLPALPSRRQS